MAILKSFFKYTESVFLSEPVLLLGILTISAALRFAAIKTIPSSLGYDEAYNGIDINEICRTGKWHIFYPENFGREGLFLNIQSLFVCYFGNTTWSLKIASGFFGILTVISVYFFAKIMYGRNIALWSALFMGTGFWHLIFSRTGFRAIMSPFFLSAGMLFLTKSFKNLTISEEKIEYTELNKKNNLNPLNVHQYLLAALGGIFYGLGFHSYIAYRISPLLVLYVFYYFYGKLQKYKREFFILAAVFCVSTFLTVLPLLLHFVNNPKDFFKRISDVNRFSFKLPIDIIRNIIITLLMFNFYGDSNWRHNIAHEPVLCFPAGVCFLLGIYDVVIKTYKKFLETQTKGPEIEHFGNRFLLFWFALFMVPAILSEGNPHSLRCIIMTVPTYIFAGIGAEKIREFLFHHFQQNYSNLLRICMLGFIIILVLNVTVQYFSNWAGNNDMNKFLTPRITNLALKIKENSMNANNYYILQQKSPNASEYSTECWVILRYLLNVKTTEELARNYGTYLISPDENITIPADAYFHNMTDIC